MTRNATLADTTAVLALWNSARSEHAETAALWRAAGDRDDVEIARWVRSLP